MFINLVTLQTTQLMLSLNVTDTPTIVSGLSISAQCRNDDKSKNVEFTSGQFLNGSFTYTLSDVDITTCDVTISSLTDTNKLQTCQINQQCEISITAGQLPAKTTLIAWLADVETFNLVGTILQNISLYASVVIPNINMATVNSFKSDLKFNATFTYQACTTKCVTTEGEILYDEKTDSLSSIFEPSIGNWKVSEDAPPNVRATLNVIEYFGEGTATVSNSIGVLCSSQKHRIACYVDPAMFPVDISIQSASYRPVFARRVVETQAKFIQFFAQKAVYRLTLIGTVCNLTDTEASLVVVSPDANSFVAAVKQVNCSFQFDWDSVQVPMNYGDKLRYTIQSPTQSIMEVTADVPDFAVFEFADFSLTKNVTITANTAVHITLIKGTLINETFTVTLGNYSKSGIQSVFDFVNTSTLILSNKMKLSVFRNATKVYAFSSIIDIKPNQPNTVTADVSAVPLEYGPYGLILGVGGAVVGGFILLVGLIFMCKKLGIQIAADKTSEV